MVELEIISKSIDAAIFKCMPKFETMKTPKQIAKYFHLKYEEFDRMPTDTMYNKNMNQKYLSEDYDEMVEYTGEVYSFTDPNNDNCRILISKNFFEKETGNLVSDWYKGNKEYREEHPEKEFDEDTKKYIENNIYPLKQFIKDYMDIPSNIKSSVGEIVLDMESSLGGQCFADEEGKSLINISRVDSVVFNDSDIVETPRKTLFHEVSHAFSNKVQFETKDDIYWDIPKCDYISNTKEYKKGQKEDRKLTGDYYATSYGASSKSKVEEQADVCSAMLMKALNKDDKDYNNRKMALADGKTYISIDDFLKRYPNRVSALNKYLELEL